MPSVKTAEEPSFKVPVCPTCAKAMRLEGLAPDRTYRDLSHMMYMCDCGRRSDQLVADPSPTTPETVLGRDILGKGNSVAPTRRKMIESAGDLAAYCYAAADLCAPGKHRDYFLSRAQGWEYMRRNVERDTRAIAESRELLARLQAGEHEPVCLKVTKSEQQTPTLHPPYPPGGSAIDQDLL